MQFLREKNIGACSCLNVAPSGLESLPCNACCAKSQKHPLVPESSLCMLRGSLHCLLHSPELRHSVENMHGGSALLTLKVGLCFHPSLVKMAGAGGRPWPQDYKNQLQFFREAGGDYRPRVEDMLCP